MPRKLKKGYFVKGQFIAEGSELDLFYKAELKGTTALTRADLKRHSDALQDLGEALLTLRSDLFKKLELPETLVNALAEAKRITNFEGKRRQMQYIGKQMRRLDEATVQAIRDAMDVQRQGSASEKLLLHTAEHWRDRLIIEDSAVAEWISNFPSTDIQQLRALVRQARKDAPPADNAAVSQGLAPRKGRAYRELFQLVRDQIMPQGSTQAADEGYENEGEDDDA